MKKRTLLLVLSCALLFGIAVGGTIAWLQATTEEVTNTFTAGDVDITLTETKPEDYTAKMIPGSTIEKDPKVTVLAGSEPCYVYVKITESTNLKLSDYIEYTVADGWTALEGHPGVYWRVMESYASSNVEYPILANDKVTVKSTVTKEMMDAITDANAPKLTFKAYAIQKENIANAATGWTQGGFE